MSRRVGRAPVFLVAGALATALPSGAAEWDWTIVPYLWGAGVTLDVEWNDDPLFGGDLSFADILDKTEFAAMAHFEGRRGKVGFLADALYLSLGETTTTAPDPPLLPDGASADTEITTAIYEVAAFYRPSAGASGFDVLAGLRAIDYGLDLEVARTTPLPASRSIDASETFFDGFVGARFGRPIAGRWAYRLRADVGAGDTELTWNVAGLVGLHFGQTEKYGLDFGYRHMEVELEQEESVTVESELTFSGPIVGFVFRF